MTSLPCSTTRSAVLRAGLLFDPARGPQVTVELGGSFVGGAGTAAFERCTGHALCSAIELHTQ